MYGYGTTLTLVGGSSEGFVDGAGALFTDVLSLAMDAAMALLYVTDTRIIRVVDLSTRNVTTLAGGGSIGGKAGGFSDGVGVQATFNDFLRLGIAGSGAQAVIYVADQYNSAVRAISVGTRTVTTVAVLPSYVTGIAVDGNAGIIYVSENFCISSIALQSPVTVTIIAGQRNIYSAIIIDGLGSNAKFEYPGLSSISDGLLYLNDADCVRSVDITTAAVMTLACHGIAIAPNNSSSIYEASMNPRNVAADGRGNIFISAGFLWPGGNPITFVGILAVSLSSPSTNVSFSPKANIHLYTSPHTVMGLAGNVNHPLYGVAGIIDGVGSNAFFGRPPISIVTSQDARILFVADGTAIRTVCINSTQEPSSTPWPSPAMSVSFGTSTASGSASLSPIVSPSSSIISCRHRHQLSIVIIIVCCCCCWLQYC